MNFIAHTADIRASAYALSILPENRITMDVTVIEAVNRCQYRQLGLICNPDVLFLTERRFTINSSCNIVLRYLISVGCSPKYPVCRNPHIMWQQLVRKIAMEPCTFVYAKYIGECTISRFSSV